MKSMIKESKRSLIIKESRTNVIAKKNKRSLISRILEHKYLYLLGLPGIIFFIVFKYLPLYNLLIAFQDYNPYQGILHSQWVGFANFATLFKDPQFFVILRNTLVVSLLSICIFPAPVILALLLNEVRNMIYKRMVQTVVYLPHFVSWVIVISLSYLFLSSQIGYVNNVITHLGGHSIAFLFKNSYFYPIIASQNIWKSVGWGSIIYMAAIAGINPSLYEAAEMDGASKLRQIWHITLPGIMPTMVILFILQLGSTLDVDFEQLWLMQNPTNLNLSEVFDTFVFKTGVQNGQYSFTTAIGFFKSIVSLILIVGANFLARRRGHEGIW